MTVIMVFNLKDALNYILYITLCNNNIVVIQVDFLP